MLLMARAEARWQADAEGLTLLTSSRSATGFEDVKRTPFGRYHRLRTGTAADRS
jgi:hypothetical protein